MSYRALLDRVAVIKRMVLVLDEYGTPQPPEIPSVVATIPCAVSRQTISAVQGAPMVVSGISYRLYFMIGAPVREGDLAEIEDVGKFRLASPYRPRNHHIEVDGSWEGEA